MQMQRTTPWELVLKLATTVLLLDMLILSLVEPYSRVAVKLSTNSLEWETHGVSRNITVNGVTPLHFGPLISRNKYSMRRKMMVSSTFHLINGDLTGLQSLSATITRSTTNQPMKVGHPHSEKVDNQALGLSWTTQLTKMSSLNAHNWIQESSHQVAKQMVLFHKVMVSLSTTQSCTTWALILDLPIALETPCTWRIYQKDNIKWELLTLMEQIQDTNVFGRWEPSEKPAHLQWNTKTTTSTNIETWDEIVRTANKRRVNR